MRVVIWLTEGTWQACVDSARDLPAAEFVLLHVIDPDQVEAIAGARAGLLGRGLPSADTSVHEQFSGAESALFDLAESRLGRPATRLARYGRPEREVVAACADAGMLVLARDGDHTRLGPRSLGHATRFVVDHAPCRVLLAWPDQPPDVETLPPPPSAPR